MLKRIVFLPRSVRIASVGRCNSVNFSSFRHRSIPNSGQFVNVASLVSFATESHSHLNHVTYRAGVPRVWPLTHETNALDGHLVLSKTKLAWFSSMLST